ncbi:DNA polymerase III subunit alpha [Candidatus Vidania fulgoroideorum]
MIKIYSEFSLQNGSVKIKKIKKICIKKKYKYCLLNDIFNISGAYRFYNSLKSKQIKPILGCEILCKIKNVFGNITIICKNYLGYKEICKLISKKTVYKKKYLSLNSILKLKNIYILSGGLNGIYTSIIKNTKLCNKLTKLLNKNNNFYIEIQRFNKKSFTESNILINLSKQTNVPIVYTHPVRYLKKKDIQLHLYKYCILTKIFLVKKNNIIKKFKNNYFLSKKHIDKKFSDIKKLSKNNYIIKNCNFNFKKAQNFCFKKKSNIFIKLKKKLNKITRFFKKKQKKTYKKRLIKEFKVIKKKKFLDFFLIVKDFVTWAKQKKIQVGPGRGSCSSSLVSYLLNITEIDPIRHNLIFERFLNKKKKSLPDFDIDFCKVDRKKVLKYVKAKYKKRIFNLVTFGKFSFKNSIKDSGRILGYSFGYLNKISKDISFNKKKKLKDILRDKKIKQKYHNDNRFVKIIKISLNLDGYLRNIGTHAGGVVITKKKFYNYFPIYYVNKLKITQFDKYDIETMGFLKFDFLGLNTLTIMKDITKKINIKFSFLKLNFSDKKTFNLLKTGNTTGVFQLENNNLKRYLKILKPASFNDLVNIISLYRPGPMDLIKTYCENKKLKKTSINKILKETRGVIIFQEQLIKIIKTKFNLNLNDSDIFRTILSKGNKKQINKFKKKIIKNNNKKNKKLFNYIKKYSGYSFNKAHAVSYSTLTFAMCWLKANYINFFFISNFKFSFNNKKKIKNLYLDCIKNNIIFYPPDINNSEIYFKTYNILGSSRFIKGFLFINGVGKNAVKQILTERKNGIFLNFIDFLFRIKKRIVNSRVVKNLIYSGCFDNIEKNRFNLIDKLNSYNKKKIKNNKQINLFKNNFKIKKFNIFLKEKKTIYYFYSDIKRFTVFKKTSKNFFIGIYKKKFKFIIVENSFINKKFFFINNVKNKNKNICVFYEPMFCYNKYNNIVKKYILL